MAMNGVPGLRILVVEDNDDAAQTMAELLRMFGHEVETAGRGPAAVEMARKDMPDVVLLDIGLPGLNGYQVARQLSATRSSNPPLLIAVTGYGREEDRQLSLECGIALHLIKPVDPTELRGILSRFQEVRARGGLSDCPL